MKEKILILGTGALATLFAVKLSSVGIKVVVLGTWQEALEKFRQFGAQMNGGDKFPVHATSDLNDCLGTEMALVLVKSWQTARVAEQLEACLKPEGLAISLQNGLGNISILEDALGIQRAVAGVTIVGATLTAPGRVHQAGDGPIWLQKHPRIHPAAKMLRKAGLQVFLVDDIQTRVWGKLVINTAINPLTSIIRVNNGALIKDPYLKEILVKIAKETALVANAHGVTLPFPDPEQAVIEVVKNTADNYSSMLRDILRNVNTEIEEINGAVIKIGETYGLSLPINQLVYKLVKLQRILTSKELMHMIRLCDD